jgi:hypothetical protein
MSKNPWSSLVVMVALLVGTTFSPYVSAQEEETAAGNSKLTGKIVAADGKTGVGGATVLAYHLASEQLFRSEPTNSKGTYQIDNLPYGYYDVGVQTESGLFVGNQVVNMPPSGKTTLTLTVTSFAEGAPASQARPFPGITEPSTGIATTAEKVSGRDFWRSPKGIGIIAGGGALLLAWIASSGSSSEDPATDF